MSQPTDPLLTPIGRLDRYTALHGRALVFGLVGYLFLLRLFFSARIELLPEETYYWNYSRHLDIGYLDHPPMVAWLIRLATSLLGNGEAGVRAGALLCGVVTAFFVFRLTRNLFGERSALIALLLSQLLPFHFMAGLLMTPDAPLTAAWAAGLYCLERALVAGRPGAWWAAGLSLGLGLLSKYTIGMLGVAAGLFMIGDPMARRWLRRFEPYAGALLALIVFAPVIVWNAQHDWASFAFQTARRLADRPTFALPRLIGAAVVLLTPAGILAMSGTIFRPRPPVEVLALEPAACRAWRLLQLAVAVPLIVFAAFSLRHEVKLDWTGAPWVAALPLIARSLDRALATDAKFWRGLAHAWPPTLAALLLTFSVGFYHLAFGLPGVGYSAKTELLPVGWRDLAAQVDRIADGLRAAGAHDLLVVGMDRYAIASEVAFYSRDPLGGVPDTSSGHLFGGVGLMYERWFPPPQQDGRDLLLVAWDTDSLDAGPLAGRVERLGPIRQGTLSRDGRTVRRFYWRPAFNYRPGAAN